MTFEHVREERFAVTNVDTWRAREEFGDRHHTVMCSVAECEIHPEKGWMLRSA
jgi:hypothetical protein